MANSQLVERYLLNHEILTEYEIARAKRLCTNPTHFLSMLVYDSLPPDVRMPLLKKTLKGETSLIAEIENFLRSNKND